MTGNYTDAVKSGLVQNGCVVGVASFMEGQSNDRIVTSLLNLSARDGQIDAVRII